MGVNGFTIRSNNAPFPLNVVPPPGLPAFQIRLNTTSEEQTAEGVYGINNFNTHARIMTITLGNGSLTIAPLGNAAPVEITALFS